MEIEIKASEVRVGDIFGGEKIIAIEVGGISVVLWFTLFSGKTLMKDADVLVTRKVDRITSDEVLYLKP